MVSSILQEGYFLLEYSVNYRCINYFQDKTELAEYIKCEFEATDGEIISKSSFEDLLKGRSFIQDSRQGMKRSVFHVLLVHGTNLESLFKFLTEIDFEDDEGSVIPFDEMLQDAEDENEISDIIEYYNDVQDNYW